MDAPMYLLALTASLTVLGGFGVVYLGAAALVTGVASFTYGRRTWAVWLTLAAAMAIHVVLMALFHMLGGIVYTPLPAGISRDGYDAWPNPWSWPRLTFPLLYLVTVVIARLVGARIGTRVEGRGQTYGPIVVAAIVPYLCLSYAYSMLMNACIYDSTLSGFMSSDCD